ncbi:MAG: hypothetical protein HQM09_18810 [Candidatus Riflebacteria bacterium]|nr:hypothetical protein [Candidatus Riflebacteria bacterium]
MTSHSFRSQRPNILVVYVWGGAVPRPTFREHLYSFQRYADANVAMLNLAWGGVPDFLRQVQWDIVIFHTSFMTPELRQVKPWDGRENFKRAVRRAEAFRTMPALKVILPQDEFYYSGLTVKFIRDFDIRHVFSVAPPSCWSQIYNGTDFGKVFFHRVLTGFIDEEKARQQADWFSPGHQRNIDIGYRCLPSTYFWYGRHGLLKLRIAEVIKKHASPLGLKLDISTALADVINGDPWYDFLGSCRYSIGAESGTSLIDFDGQIAHRCQEYVARNPGASFEEVEKTCFPGMDGTCKLVAIGPRHLESCMTGTTQILVEGEYGGILKPGRHYLELRRDFSNVDEVLMQVSDESLRRELMENVRRDIIDSGQYTYRRFTEGILETALHDRYNRSGSNLPLPDEKTFLKAEEREAWGRIFALPRLRFFSAPRSLRINGVAHLLRKIRNVWGTLFG